MLEYVTEALSNLKEHKLCSVPSYIPIDEVALNLSKNMLNDVSDYSHLRKLGDLRHLRLTGNKITHPPQEIFVLSQLSELYIDHNELETVPDEIGTLCELTVLDLAYNKLSQLPNGLSSLSQLELLNIENNKFTTIPDCVCQLESLEELQANGNVIETISDSIIHLKSLRLLKLSYNSLAGLPKGVSELRSLEVLHLSRNKLRHDLFPHDELLKLRRLNELIVHFNPGLLIDPRISGTKNPKYILTTLAEQAVDAHAEEPDKHSEVRRSSMLTGVARSRKVLQGVTKKLSAMEVFKKKEKKKKRSSVRRRSSNSSTSSAGNEVSSEMYPVEDPFDNLGFTVDSVASGPTVQQASSKHAFKKAAGVIKNAGPGHWAGYK